MKGTAIRVVATLIVSLVSLSNNMSTQTSMNNNQSLDEKAQSIVTISAFTAIGDLEQLRNALNRGLDSGLTVNETKEVLAHLYAYCGFPRSLNAINTLMSVVDERKKRGITDVEGKTATPLNDATDKYERGRKRLETLTGQPQSKPAKGFGEFSPTIDRFLKEHLFADIFDSDVLSSQQRELVTISALTVMLGVEPQLESHLAMGMNTGLTESQLKEVFDLIGKNVGNQQAEAARKSLVKVTAGRQKMTITRSGQRTSTKGPEATFTGNVTVEALFPLNPPSRVSGGSVTFEPGARSAWHTHPLGQILIVTAGKGWVQQQGSERQEISVGDVIWTPPGVKHWHGATTTSSVTHIAIQETVDGKNVEWLEKVSDEQYLAKPNNQAPHH